MSGGDLGSLLERLRAEGDAESEGFFTLDPERAQQLLGKFQLADPHHYAVHIVAAAVAGGATRIDLTRDAEGFGATFDGRPWTAQELEAVFSSLFARRTDPELVRLKELGVALLAALRLAPGRLVVESGETRMEVRPDGPVLSLRRSEPVTRIQLKERVNLKLVGRLLSRETSGEQKAIEARCRLAPVPITFNQKLVTRPPDLEKCLVYCAFRHSEHSLPETTPDSLVAGERESPGDFSALLAFPREAPATLTVVVNGVAYHPPHTGDFTAVVATGPLPTDASRSELAESPRLKALQDELRACRRTLLELLAEAWTPEHPRELEKLLLKAAREDHQALQHLPLLLDARGDRLSLAGAREEYKQRGYLLTTNRERPWPHSPPGGERVLLKDALRGPLLDHHFPDQRSGERLLHLGIVAARNRQEWEQRLPVEPRLEAELLARSELSGGEVGFAWNFPEPAITFLKEGRLLGVLEYRTRFPRGLTGIVDRPDVTPNELWNGVKRECPAVKEVEAAIDAALPDLYLRLIAHEPESEAEASLRDTLLLERLRVLVERGEDPAALGSVPLFQLVDGSRASFDELVPEVAVQGYLPVAGRLYELPPGHHQKVVLSGQDTEALKAVFGTLRSWSRQLQDAEQKERRRRLWEESQPRLPARLSDDALARAPLPELRGEAGLPRRPPPQARLTVLRSGRSLGERYLDVATLPPGLEVVVDLPQLDPDIAWSGTLDPDELEQVFTAARQVLPALYPEVLEHPRAGEYVRGYLEYLAAGEFDPSQLEPVADFPLVHRLDGTRLALSQLTDPEIFYLPEALADRQGAPPEALLLDSRDQAILESLLGPRLKRVTLVRDPVLGKGYSLVLKLPKPLEGEFGIPEVWPEPPYAAEVVLLPGGRRFFPNAYPVRAIVATEGADPDARAARVLEALPDLEKACGAPEAPPPARAAHLLSGGDWPEADRLRALLDPEAPLPVFRNLLGERVHPDRLYLVKEQGFSPADAVLLPPGEAVPVIRSWEQGALLERFPGIRNYSHQLKEKVELLAQLPVDHGELPPGDYYLQQGDVGLVAPYEMSLVKLIWKGRLLKELVPEPRVAYRARLQVDEPDEEPSLAGLAAVARELAAEAVEKSSGSERLRRYSLELWLRDPGEELVHLLEQARLFVTATGDRLSLTELRGAERLLYLSESFPSDDPFLEAALAMIPEPVLRLAYVERRVLEAHFRLEDVGERVGESARRLAEAASQRVTSLDLEDHFPGQRWLVRRRLDDPELEGEIGLPVQPPRLPGLVVTLGRVPLERDDPFPGLGLVGIVNAEVGSFEELGARLEPSVDRLVHRLADRLPPPSSPDFERAREVVLRWAFRHGDGLREIPLLPAVPGRWASLQELLDEGRLLYCLPDEEPPASDQLVLVMVPTSRLALCLQEGLGLPLERWKPADAEPSERTPEERLVQGLQDELLALQRLGRFNLDRAALKTLTLGEVEQGLFGNVGGRLTLSRRHSAVARLLAEPLTQEQLYFLLPQLFDTIGQPGRPARRAFFAAVAARICTAPGSGVS